MQMGIGATKAMSPAYTDALTKGITNLAINCRLCKLCVSTDNQYPNKM